MEVSGRYSNPPPHAVDLRELRLAYRKSRATTVQTRPSKQQQRRLHPDDIEHLRAGYLGGVKVADLAERFGIARQTVLEHVRRLGLPHRHPKLSPKETSQAVRLYETGNSLAVVGTAFGVDPGTIRRPLAGEVGSVGSG